MMIVLIAKYDVAYVIKFWAVSYIADSSEHF